MKPPGDEIIVAQGRGWLRFLVLLPRREEAKATFSLQV